MIKKNSLSLTLLTFFTIPALASWTSKEFPLGEKGKFIASVLATEIAIDSLLRITGLPKVVDLDFKQSEKTFVDKLFSITQPWDQSTVLAERDLAERSKEELREKSLGTGVDTNSAEYQDSIKPKYIDSISNVKFLLEKRKKEMMKEESPCSFTLNLERLGVDRLAQINIASLAIYGATCYGLITLSSYLTKPS